MRIVKAADTVLGVLLMLKFVFSVPEAAKWPFGMLSICWLKSCQQLTVQNGVSIFLRFLLPQHFWSSMSLLGLKKGSFCFHTFILLDSKLDSKIFALRIFFSYFRTILMSDSYLHCSFWALRACLFREAYTQTCVKLSANLPWIERMKLVVVFFHRHIRFTPSLQHSAICKSPPRARMWTMLL